MFFVFCVRLYIYYVHTLYVTYILYASIHLYTYRRTFEPADYYPDHNRLGAPSGYISAPSVNACAIFRVQYICLCLMRTMIYFNGWSVVGAKRYRGFNAEPSLGCHGDIHLSDSLSRSVQLRWRNGNSCTKAKSKSYATNITLCAC